MNFNFPLLGAVRMLLFPVSLIYFVVIWIRNRLYDRNLFKSASFNLPVICVGNIAVGGTGKSPMVEYLVRALKDEYLIATLSRGYKRKTKGYALADETSTALHIGDEPMQFHIKFPDVSVTVGEERLVAIPQLLQDRPDTQVIILDDAFQHRAIRAGLNILLVECGNLFTRDWYLPTGDLRDEKKSYRRADIIVITKSNPDLSEPEKQDIIEEIEPLKHQHVFFTRICYGTPYHIVTKEKFLVNENVEVLLVTGIANPKPLKKWLQEKAGTYFQLSFSDHHIFTIDDLKDIIKRFKEINAETKILITTEKDAVRLTKFENELKELPFYVMPIEQEFLFNEGIRFDNLVKGFINNFKLNT
jgi:tetraacyldisaccharide 4'-kinase